MLGAKGFLPGFLVGALLCAGLAVLLAIFNPIAPDEEQLAEAVPNVQAEEVETALAETPVVGETMPNASVATEEFSPTDDASDAPEIVVETEAEPAAPLTQAPQIAQPIEETTEIAPVPDEAEDAPQVEIATPSQPVADAGKVDVAQESPQAPEVPQIATESDEFEADQALENGGAEPQDVPRIPVPQAEEALVAAPEQTEIVAAPQTDEPAKPAEIKAEGAGEEQIASAQDVLPNSDQPEVVDQAEEEVAAAPETDVALPPAPIVNSPAFEAFAADFTPHLGKPYLSIVLQHVEEGGVSMDALMDLDLPVTFAVDPSATRARNVEDTFRSAGYEVVAIVPDRGEMNLSQRTQLDQVESILTSYFDSVPGAVAIIDRPLGDFYRNIRVVNVITQALNKSGRGLLIHERFGINAALGSAAAKRVPVASVKRVIDTNIDKVAINASLDRAALAASKTGSAVVFGRTYPETIAALKVWMLGNTARSVALAPITATVVKP